MNFFGLVSLLVTVALSDHPGLRLTLVPLTQARGMVAEPHHRELPDELTTATAARLALLCDGTGPAAQRWPSRAPGSFKSKK